MSDSAIFASIEVCECPNFRIADNPGITEVKRVSLPVRFDDLGAAFIPKEELY